MVAAGTDNWQLHQAGRTRPYGAAARTALLAATLAIAPVSAAAGPAAASADAQCFAPSELAAKPGEIRPVRGIAKFNAAEPARDIAPYAPVPAGLRGAIRRVELPPGRKLVALTLDLCEQPGEVAGYDGAIFDLLRKEGIKATLFTGGKWMRSHEARFGQLLLDPLFEIANHATAHRNLRLLSGRALMEEIEGPQRAFEAIRSDLATSANQCVRTRATQLPSRMGLFRFPYGACNDAALKAVNDAGLLAIQWDVSTGDPWPGQSAKAIAESMIRGVKPGSIVIAHANGRGFNTAQGLPIAIAALKARGYEFVTVSELLAAGKPVIANTCYNTKPGDTDRYDRPFAAKPAAPATRIPGTSTGAASAAAPQKLPWQ